MVTESQEGSPSALPGTADAVPSIGAESSILSHLLHAGEQMLATGGVTTARLDAEVLLAAALSTNRAGVYARLRQPAPAAERDRFAAMVERRARREPIAYILGYKEFYSLDFIVSPEVLIPRPETEHLVELAMAHLAARDRSRICDVGTGSGCVAVALAHGLPGATVVASDISPAALRVARRNAGTHGVTDRIAFIAGDLLGMLSGNFDAIVSNPPYLRSGERGSPELEWEPLGALESGADGLDAVRGLLAHARGMLADEGLLAIEIGAAQSEDAMALARAAGFDGVTVKPDLAGFPRVLVGYR